MTKLKVINEEEEEKEKDFDNKLDVIQFCSEVHTKTLKKDVKQDLILATLTDKQTQYCKEMIRNAYFTKKVIEQITQEMTKRMKKQTKKTQKKWKQQIPKIRNIANKTFQTLILPVDATAILQRNKPNNHLLRLLLGLEETQTPNNNTENEQTNTLNYIKEKLKPNEKT